MIRSVQTTIGLALALGVLGGCKSKVEECRERNLEVERRQIAACGDEACRDKARKDRRDFDEACDNMK